MTHEGSRTKSLGKIWGINELNWSSEELMDNENGCGEEKETD